MDASVATGAAAMMAIRILLDHDVREENILLVSLLMAAQGVHAIAYAYPKGDFSDQLLCVIQSCRDNCPTFGTTPT